MDYEKELRAITQIRRLQRVWWIAIFLLGAAFGFLVAEVLLDPVKIIVQAGGGIKA